jgi:hypothetical protein
MHRDREKSFHKHIVTLSRDRVYVIDDHAVEFREPGDECRELPPKSRPGSQARSRTATSQLNTEEDRKARRRRRQMIVAQRQSALAKRTVSDNDQFARPPLLILIDAPFPSRLARYIEDRRYLAGAAAPGPLTLLPSAGCEPMSAAAVRSAHAHPSRACDQAFRLSMWRACRPTRFMASTYLERKTQD